jgi:hypothetical protein
LHRSVRILRGDRSHNQAVPLWFDKGAGKAFGLVGVGLTALPIVALPVITWDTHTPIVRNANDGIIGKINDGQRL